MLELRDPRRRVLVWALPVAALALLASSFGPAPRSAHAAPAGSFIMSPSNIYLDLGESIAVTIIINGGQDIHEVHFALAYDPGVVEVVDAEAGQAGVQVLKGPFPDSSVPGTILQNVVSGGVITYQYVLPSGEMDAGSGTVATVQFLGVGAGSANFSWQVIQIVDSGGVPFSGGGSAASLVVGVDTPTPGPTNTATPGPGPSDTPVPAATATPEPTSTPADATATPVEPSSTPPATSTGTPIAATTTPRITVVQDSNQGEPPQSSIGVDPSQTDRAGGLPSAGIGGAGIAWWRWVFFLAALAFGVAGWFFTLAVYKGSREVVLIDKGDRRRKRR